MCKKSVQIRTYTSQMRSAIASIPEEEGNQEKMMSLVT